MSICVVVADDHGARQASHALRAGGWGAVHFEGDAAAAVRLTSNGKPTVLNTGRLDAATVAEAIDNLERLGAGYDWRQPPPELSQDEWAVLYALATEESVDAVAAKVNMSPRTTARRIATAREKFGVETQAELLSAFARWKLPTP